MEGQQPSAENGRVSEDYTEGREKGHHSLNQVATGSFPAFFGKHRLQAAITHLNNEITIMQEELTQLETIGESSTVCKDVISSVESIPDPLLPLTKGSVDAGWDRWFGGAPNSRNHKRWI
ncbi:guanine nucleotide-binding protein subunit gamma 2-like [Gastrolobium bilobum]|uniref:guanine nucleotide-binding protein subunit gamma 2-like n=1 Tax=Gastrolobium bilobum TaxID=150636 RepID=UPI002AB1939C|nr:guanine nucleotide-binding protein subunit gamma 2-like [Gastrolobium bilobum]